MTKTKEKKKHISKLNMKKLGCCDISSFDFSIARVIALALRELSDITSGYPQSFSSLEEWKTFCRKIAYDIDTYLEYTKMPSDWDGKKEERLAKVAEKAMMRFTKNWRSFWI